MQSSEFPYKIVRSTRKSIAIQITRTGQVVVRCPAEMSNMDVHKFVLQKSEWIRKHLSNIEHISTLPSFTNEELYHLSVRAAQIIPQRVSYYAPKVNVTYGRISIRKQHTRWGSCSSNGNLNFNCLLMLTPPEVLDYVVVHELCHRKEMSHSIRFWAEVEKILPDYRIRRQWLKDHGSELICRLP